MQVNISTPPSRRALEFGIYRDGDNNLDLSQSLTVALHAKEHPEDAGRTIDGVVANQCLMSTMGFADALSRVGVRWLAASPET